MLESITNTFLIKAPLIFKANSIKVRYNVFLKCQRFSRENTSMRNFLLALIILSASYECSSLFDRLQSNALDGQPLTVYRKFFLRTYSRYAFLMFIIQGLAYPPQAKEIYETEPGSDPTLEYFLDSF